MPLVTVGLPIYNAERFLEEALRSILDQTLVDFEVIAVLDGCTDRSEEILERVRDGRFRIIRKERNAGIVAALNDVIAAGTCPLIARMDADDVMLPARLEKQVTFLAAHPEVDVLGTWYQPMDEAGKNLRPPHPFAASHEDILRAFRKYNSLGHPTVMFRTERIRALGGYAPDVLQAEDLTLWLKCLAAGYRFANMPEPLLRYRVHPQQTTRTTLAETFRLTNLAYRQYGAQIWGDDVPEMDLGAPFYRRALRRLKSMLRDLRRSSDLTKP